MKVRYSGDTFICYCVSCKDSKAEHNASISLFMGVVLSIGAALLIYPGVSAESTRGEVMQAGDRGCAAAYPGGGYPGEIYGGGIRCVMETRVLQMLRRK